MTRPSETIQAVVGQVIGALLIVGGVFFDMSKITAEVAGALILLVSWIATGVTWYIGSQQRQGNKVSGADGTVSAS